MLAYWDKQSKELANSLKADELTTMWTEAVTLLKEIGEWFKATQKERSALMSKLEAPKPPKGMFSVGGITRLIDGGVYYLRDKSTVIIIPQQYEGLYIQQRGDSPNMVVVDGWFRFTGNKSGKNAFGAEVPVETYEVDAAYSDALRRFYILRKEARKQLGPDDHVGISDLNDGFSQMLAQFEKVAGKEIAEKTKQQIGAAGAWPLPMLDIERALSEYEARNDNPPATHAEFMQEIIQGHKIELPPVADGYEYVFDPANSRDDLKLVPKK